MKVNYHHKLIILLFFLAGTTAAKIQAQDSAAATTILSLRYFLPENKVPYIEINTKKKTGRIFEPVKGVAVNVYFNETSERNLLGKITTASNGIGKVAIPASFKAAWDSATEVKFLAVSDSSKEQESLNSDVTIKKAILILDTALVDGVRTITAQLKEKKGNEWIAVKEIEMKVGVKRLGGNLTVGDADTYTSDSTGLASAAYKRDSLAGDEKGNLILVAKVEDNDIYGNLIVEKSVLWGKAVQADTHFWHRTLWSTGNRAPVWLIFIAFAIIAGVWSTIIYLVRQIIKIKKIGKEYERTATAIK